MGIKKVLPSFLDMISRLRQHFFSDEGAFGMVAKNVRGVPGCKYRGDNDSRCAIGCLITDEEYASLTKPEDMTPAVLFEHLGYSVSSKQASELLSLRQAHDFAANSRTTSLTTNKIRFSKSLDTLATAYSKAMQEKRAAL